MFATTVVPRTVGRAGFGRSTKVNVTCKQLLGLGCGMACGLRVAKSMTHTQKHLSIASLFTNPRRCLVLVAAALALSSVPLGGCGGEASVPVVGVGGGGGGGQAPAQGCNCASNEICQTCQSAGPTTYTCRPEPTLEADQFACRWLACDAGQVCLTRPPLQDSCSAAQCVELPAECEATPSCDCVPEKLNHYSNFDCSTDAEGNMTIHKRQ